jgi:serine/threonine protein kinase
VNERDTRGSLPPAGLVPPVALPARIDDRYELQSVLGSGGTATVYAARDLKLARDVAVKLMHEQPTGDEARRFQREVMIAARFHHADVIAVYDVLEYEGRPCIVMELVRAPSLATALQTADGPPSIATAVELAAKLAEMLAAAHAAGLVHRDVKPANVFVEGELAAPERCRLSDFGLAFMVQPESQTLGRFTAENVLLGTPLYIAPEQAEGREVGPPADIYSLGCVIHELVAGRPPFVGNIARIIAGHLYLPPIGLCELASGVPPDLELLVLSMLDKEPWQRPTAEDVARRLCELGQTAPNKRSSTLLPRSARAFGARPLEVPTATRPQVTLEVDDAVLAAELRARGVEVGTEGIVIVAFEALGRVRDDGRRYFVLHPNPSSSVISEAIRAGAVGVARWPGAADGVARQLRIAWRHTSRVPRQ